MKCKICGSELEPGAVVCRYCGNEIDVSPLTEPDNDLSGDEDFMKLYHINRREEDGEPDGAGDGVPDGGMAEAPEDSGEPPVSLPPSGGPQQRSSEEEEDHMRKNPPKKKKKRPVRTAVLMTLAMMAIFAITFTIFFHLLGGSFVSEEESTQTPEATLPAAVTEEATEKAEEKATEKPSVVEKVKEKAESAINSVTEKHTEAPAETETPAAAEEETAGHAEDSDYLFESARYVIRQAELESRSRQEIKLIYYEIYARHGYDFQDTELKEYFSGKTWYNPVTSHREEAEAGFNVVERENIEVIERYQTEQGWR